jgi:uncharacterized protein (DUF779 family)
MDDTVSGATTAVEGVGEDENQGEGRGAFVPRVAVTSAAADLLRALRVDHGPLMFHQSGGCCDGSAPMCYPAGDFIVGSSDIYLGALDVSTSVDPFEPIPVYIGRPQFEYWSHTHLTIDVVPGRGAGFSLEAPTGNRFIIHSRLFTDTETELLENGGDLARPAG